MRCERCLGRAPNLSYTPAKAGSFEGRSTTRALDSFLSLENRCDTAGKVRAVISRVGARPRWAANPLSHLRCDLEAAIAAAKRASIFWCTPVEAGIFDADRRRRDLESFSKPGESVRFCWQRNGHAHIHTVNAPSLLSPPHTKLLSLLPHQQRSQLHSKD